MCCRRDRKADPCPQRDVGRNAHRAFRRQGEDRPRNNPASYLAASTRAIVFHFFRCRSQSFHPFLSHSYSVFIRSTNGHSNPGQFSLAVAKSYPDIRADDANIDAICMWMFKNPQDSSVLVAENMFGDIVSDLCAGLVGGLGFAPSANLGDNYAVFEPTHGSAPKYAGQYKVNPMGMLLTAKLMLDWLKESEMATRLRIRRCSRHEGRQDAHL